MSKHLIINHGYTAIRGREMACRAPRGDNNQDTSQYYEDVSEDDTVLDLIDDINRMRSFNERVINFELGYLDDITVNDVNNNGGSLSDEDAEKATGSLNDGYKHGAESVQSGKDGNDDGSVRGEISMISDDCDSVSGGDLVVGDDAVRDGDSISGGDLVVRDDAMSDGDSISAGDSVNGDDTVRDGDSISGGDSVNGNDAVRDGDSISAGDSVNGNDAVRNGDSISGGDSVNGDDAVRDGDSISCGDLVNGDDVQRDGVSIRGGDSVVGDDVVRDDDDSSVIIIDSEDDMAIDISTMRTRTQTFVITFRRQTRFVGRNQINEAFTMDKDFYEDWD